MMKIPRYLISLALVLLVACGPMSNKTDSSTEEIGVGGLSPEAVTSSFLEDLRQALKDPNLADDDTRHKKVERLAGYFAPNERDDQRFALNTALSNLASDVEPGNTVTLELHFAPPEKVIDNGQHALVRLKDAGLHLTITRMVGDKSVPFVDQEVGLSELIGNQYGVIPVIKIEHDWFLTEGWSGWERELTDLSSDGK